MKRFGLVFDDPNDGEIILYYNAEDKISAIQKEAADGEKDIEQIDKSSVNNAIFSYNVLFANEIKSGYNARLVRVYEGNNANCP
ncbi:MAG: hypothetical protein EOM59_13370 [Clostridia bacterium]|nr:hypothetical protein [Clostridia bacterium]